MKRLATLLLTVCGLFGTAAAETPPPAGSAYAPALPPGYHTHDGLYVRAFLGVNGTLLSSDTDIDVSGAGGTFGLAVGYAVTKNLILYAEIFDDIAVDPTITVGMTDAGTLNASAGVLGVGAGAAYYFMPINLYVSATLAASWITVQQGDTELASSDLGFGVSLMVGKEWWVWDDLGIGAALQIYGGSMKDQGSDAARWAAAAAALVFSATYN
jgi:hypothetical protein